MGRARRAIRLRFWGNRYHEELVAGAAQTSQSHALEAERRFSSARTTSQPSSVRCASARTPVCSRTLGFSPGGYLAENGRKTAAWRRESTWDRTFAARPQTQRGGVPEHAALGSPSRAPFGSKIATRSRAYQRRLGTNPPTRRRRSNRITAPTVEFTIARMMPVPR